MTLHGPIFVATDFSAGAAEALRQAYTLAGELRTPLVVGHVVPEAYRVRVLFPHTAGIADQFGHSSNHEPGVMVTS